MDSIRLQANASLDSLTNGVLYEQLQSRASNHVHDTSHVSCISIRISQHFELSHPLVRQAEHARTSNAIPTLRIMIAPVRRLDLHNLCA